MTTAPVVLLNSRHINSQDRRQPFQVNQGEKIYAL